jgi:Protein of unknown function (DUF3177)
MPDQPQLWFQPLIWTDSRLALIFTFIVPLVLLLWALAQRTEAIQTSLLIYWRVASLLLITLYLSIASSPISFVTGFLARLLIPLSLWFWIDLNEEIGDLSPRPLKFAYSAWRWAVSIYSLVSAIGLIPFMSCSINAGAVKTPYCQAWFQPPWLYREFVHANSKPEFLGFIGVVALMIYALYLIYFLVVRLGKQGRSAMQ